MDHLLFDLNPSAVALETGKKVIESTDERLNSIGISRIVQNITNYDDACFAGRLLIYEIVRTIKSIEMYVTLNRHILADKIQNYFIDNAEYLNKIVINSERHNYENQDYFSADTLCKSYLLKAVSMKGPTETPILKNLRIAIQLFSDESLDRVTKAFNEMNENYYTHASPTIFNAGTHKPQMASCFLMNVDDNLESMMYTGVGDMAMISRYNGGVGIGLNRIRHSDIAGSGDSAGVLPYARVCDKAIGYVDQSRKRRGAATGFLNVWHIDIEEFITASSNYIPQDLRLVDLHTCVWMHDLFFERCKRDQDWTLFCPNRAKNLNGKYGDEFEKIYLEYERLAPMSVFREEKASDAYNNLRNQISHQENPSEELREKYRLANEELTAARKDKIVYKVVKARDILHKIGDIQLKSGKPYVMNGDRCNFKSNQQNIGPINNSNLCVEIVQYSDPETFSSCNLASINLPRFSLKAYNYEKSDENDDTIMNRLSECYDFVRLGEIVESVVENLNKVIDHNFYPFDEKKIKNFNMETRPLGIGVSGLDDAFKVLDLVYGSKESILLNKMIFACMYYSALVASNKLAKIHGEYNRYRTGHFNLYDSTTDSFKLVDGSPLSNGLFQFDLWELEYQHDLKRGRINTKFYSHEDNIPVCPKLFGRNEDSWQNLRQEVMETGVRNSLLLALMPTASTAQILRNAESVEAHQANIYSRQVGNGSYTIANRHLFSDLKSVGYHQDDVLNFVYQNAGKVDGLAKFVESNYPDLSADKHARLEYLEKKYRTMFDIRPSEYLLMARQRGIYVDQSQSTNIYKVNPSLVLLMTIQVLAYDLKLKTSIYYLRNTLPTYNTGFNKKVSDLLANGTKEETQDCISCSA